MGRTHVCALETSGRDVVCWGDGREGRIGTPPEDDHGDPVGRGGLAVTSLAAGDAHTCGLTTTGEVLCWGSNAQGQLGIEGPWTAQPTALASSGRARQLAAGGTTTCAILEDGALSCWRPGGPAQRLESRELVRVAVGPREDGCVLDSKGTVSCWPAPAGGRAGTSELAAVEGLAPSRDVGVGDGFACALGQDGVVRCWGSNEGQRLGLPTAVVEQRVPMPVPELPGEIVQLAVGSRSSCALQRGGATWCWGVGSEGQLGRGGRMASGAAARVRGLARAVEVAVGHDGACAFVDDDDDPLWCWGRGPGTPVEPITQVEPVSQVAISDVEHCATDEDGRVGCWEPSATGAATFVKGVQGASDLALPDGGGCAIVEGRARCWGSGATTARHPDRGFDPDDRTVHPIPVEDVRSLAAIMERVCAIDGKSRVWCWGLSSSPEETGGMEAFGPIRVEALEGAEQIAQSRVGPECARRTDGVLACWQPTFAGQPRVRSKAEAIAGMPTVVAIAGDQVVLAVTTANEVWSIDEERTPRKLPVRLPKRATAIATSVELTCVRFEDGEVGCWMDHEADAEEPPFTIAPIHGLANVVRLVGKTDHACAVRADGSAACWTKLPPAIAEVPTKSKVLGTYRMAR